MVQRSKSPVKEVSHINQKAQIYKAIRWGLILIVLAIIGLLIINWIGTTYQKISSSWDQIQFAYNHPAIVKSVQQNYNARQTALDQSFIKEARSNQPVSPVSDLTNLLPATPSSSVLKP